MFSIFICQKQSQGLIMFFKHSFISYDLSPFKKKFKQSSLFVYFLVVFIIDFDGYYIAWTDKGQPWPKYVFNKLWKYHLFFLLQRFGPSPSSNFNSIWKYLCYPSSGIGCSEYPYTYIHFWELICNFSNYRMVLYYVINFNYEKTRLSFVQVINT